MIPIYTPQTESEVAVISSLFEAYEIPFFIRGAAFSKLYPGMQIKDYNTQTFMVPAELHVEARELLAEFINPQPQEIKQAGSASLTKILRVGIEFFLLSWVFTGNRWNKNSSEED